MNKISKTSERLKIAMKERNLTQADLVRIAGVNKGALSCYLSGKYLPKQTAIYHLSNSLNVDPVWLMGYDVPMEKPNNLEIIIKNENGDELIVGSMKKLTEEQKKTIFDMIEFYKSQNEKK